MYKITSAYDIEETLSKLENAIIQYSYSDPYMIGFVGSLNKNEKKFCICKVVEEDNMSKRNYALIIIPIMVLGVLALDTFLRHVTDYASSTMKGVTATVLLIIFGPIALILEKNCWKIWECYVKYKKKQ